MLAGKKFFSLSKYIQINFIHFCKCTYSVHLYRHLPKQHMCNFLGKCALLSGPKYMQTSKEPGLFPSIITKKKVRKDHDLFLPNRLGI